MSEIRGEAERLDHRTETPSPMDKLASDLEAARAELALMRHAPIAAALPDRFLTAKQVVELVGAARSSIFDWVRLGLFPAPKRLGVRRIGWSSREIAQWMHDRPTV